MTAPLISTGQRPTIVTVMLACCWIGIALGAVGVALNIYVGVALSGGGSGAGFAAGYVEAAGFDPAAFRAEDAGALSAPAGLLIIFAGIALSGLRARRPLRTRITSGLWILMMLGSAAFVGLALGLAVLGGSFTTAARRWFEGDEPSLGSLDPNA